MSSAEEAQFSPVSDDTNNVADARATLVNILRNRTVVLNKSLASKLIYSKEKARANVLKEFQRRTGKKMSLAKIQKILNNMKHEIKEKTGNKAIKLSHREKDLLIVLEEYENPNFKQIPGAASAGIEDGKDKHTPQERETPVLSVTKADNNAKPASKRKTGDTDETAPLSNTELQRIVLDERLRLIRTQQKREKPFVISASFIKICSRSDPHLNECVKQSVEGLRPYLAKGIPELGIPSCEPLCLPEITMNQGRGSANVRSIYKDVKVRGPSNFTLRSVKIDLEKNRIRLKLFIPELQMTSTYSIKGRILMLPIEGSGPSSGNYSDIEATCLIQGDKFLKDGKTFFNVSDIFIDFIIGNASVYMGNLFDGDKELGDAMNLFLNDNWRNIAKEVKPVLEETIADMFKNFSNKIYQKFSLNELLPP
ncbi:circadian clock-controlled protein daywake-like [Lycorma delicatula]|uniref:circadian clock-controlled protein daywake-like n=1 Tax=Lycorma delicatula TaxID=130591 RepID=UPI003F514730